MPVPIVECVPNFSEGRDQAVIEAIALSISSVPGVSLLGVEPGADANRSVFTFIGPPATVVEAAVAAAKTAYARIDMSRHSGAHPRMGALDVCPFVPVSGISLDECALLAKEAAERIAGELCVPVYLYEAAALSPERKSLAYLRSGGYEALPDKLKKGEWAPDFGPAAFVPRWGASVLGAREFLIAYNVNLNTGDPKFAAEIAGNIRESGRGLHRLKAVRAIGWYIAAYGRSQVSVNILDYKSSPLHLVYETVREEAESLGLEVEGSEIVGLLPLEPILLAGKYFLEKAGADSGGRDRAPLPEEDLVESAIRSLGLNSVAPFDPRRKILEYASALPEKG